MQKSNTCNPEILYLMRALPIPRCSIWVQTVVLEMQGTMASRQSTCVREQACRRGNTCPHRQHPVIVHGIMLQVIIAGAGGAAHLPGMVASLTPLPVVGVPCIPPGQPLDGLDALLSIVQVRGACEPRGGV